MEIKHLVITYIPLEVRTDCCRTCAGRSACEYEVARLQRAETAHIGYDFVHRKEHLRGVSLLHDLVIYCQREVDIVYVIALYGTEIAKHGRTVEALAHIPWLAGRYQAALPIARSKIYTNGYGIVITVGKTCGYALAQLVYAHHNLGLIVYLAKKIGHIEVLAVLYDGRIGLHENQWHSRFFIAAIELNRVLSIVFSNSYYLHFKSNFFCYTKPLETVEHQRQMGIE